MGDSNNEENQLDDLPEEVLINIFSHCDAADNLRLGEVCQKFKQLANDSMLWKQLFKKNFSRIHFLMTNRKEMKTYKDTHWRIIYKVCYLKQIRRFRRQRDGNSDAAISYPRITFCI